MAVQLLALVGMVLIFLVERQRYQRLERIKYMEAHQERAARQALRPRSNDVEPWGRA